MTPYEATEYEKLLSKVCTEVHQLRDVLAGREVRCYTSQALKTHSSRKCHEPQTKARLFWGGSPGGHPVGRLRGIL
jgi:hypothetical protein